MSSLKKFLLFLLLFSGMATQAQEMPKTIFELYGLPPGGCKYHPPSKKDVHQIIIEEVPDEFIMDSSPHHRRKPPTFPLEEAKQLLDSFKIIALQRNNLSFPGTKMLANGDFCFLKAGKWGLRNKRGKVIYEPQFDFIKIDKYNDGFVGYKDAKGNYYSGKRGKKQLKKDYYYIQPVEKSTYIVQSKDGYGLIRRGKIILKPNMDLVSIDRNKSRIFFKISDPRGGDYILLNDYQTKVPISPFIGPTFIGNDYVHIYNNFFNIKTQKKFFCETDFEIQLVDKDLQLLAIKKNSECQYYLTDFAGNIITSQAFTEIGKFNTHGIGMAMTVKKMPGRRRPKLQYGLIDKTGKWVVDPIYKNIRLLDQQWIFTDYNDKIGMMNALGQLKIPAEYGFIQKIDQERFLCGNRDRTKKTVDAKILNISTAATEKEHLGYFNPRVFKLCSHQYLEVNTADGKRQVLDMDFHPVTAAHNRIIITDSHIIGIDHRVAGVGTQQRLYDCEGQLISFKINGVDTNTFGDIQMVNENFVYVYLHDKSGYLVDKNGEIIPIDHHIRSFTPLDIGGLIILYSAEDNISGIIDESGQIVLPFGFSTIGQVEPETGLISFSTKDGRKGLFSLKGVLISGKLYNDLGYAGHGYYWIKTGPKGDRKTGIINKDGQVIVPTEYENIYRHGGLLIAIDFKGEVVVFDTRGERV